ncbi:MAG: hypothetical protein IKD50_14520 [Clostridia bacterium]|nr:hypothetical protein [Clostridia bacterium]
MMYRKFSAFCLLLLCILALTFATADTVPKQYKKALEYARTIQPMEMDMGKVTMKPTELANILRALPQGAVLHFQCTWKKVTFSDESEIVSLNKLNGNATREDIESIIAVCPNLSVLDNSQKMRPSNDVMISLLEQYPDIHFEWMVHLKGEHYCRTNATAYSTLNHTDAGTRLKSEDLELLKYIPGLKALDIGHNSFTDFGFLKYCPDLELLIISNNAHVDDLTAVGELKHLQYLEVHNTNISDLSPLANCHELLDLNISSTRVTDLSPLDGITTLERLWANVLTKLPQSEKDRFVALHPNCTVDFKGTSAVSHHWREHGNRSITHTCQ